MATKRTASDILAEQHWKRRMINEDTANNLQAEANKRAYLSSSQPTEGNSSSSAVTMVPVPYPTQGDYGIVAEEDSNQTTEPKQRESFQTMEADRDSTLHRSLESDKITIDYNNVANPKVPCNEQIEESTENASEGQMAEVQLNNDPLSPDKIQTPFSKQQIPPMVSEGNKVQETENYVIVQTEDGTETQIILSVSPENLTETLASAGLTIAVEEGTDQAEHHQQRAILPDTAESVNSAELMNRQVSQSEVQQIPAQNISNTNNEVSVPVTEQLTQIIQDANNIVYHVQENSAYQGQSGDNTATQYQMVCNDGTTGVKNYVLVEGPIPNPPSEAPVAGIVEGSQSINYPAHLCTNGASSPSVQPQHSPAQDCMQPAPGQHDSVSPVNDTQSQQQLYQAQPTNNAYGAENTNLGIQPAQQGFEPARQMDSSSQGFQAAQQMDSSSQAFQPAQQMDSSSQDQPQYQTQAVYSDTARTVDQRRMSSEGSYQISGPTFETALAPLIHQPASCNTTSAQAAVSATSGGNVMQYCNVQQNSESGPSQQQPVMPAQNCNLPQPVTAGVQYTGQNAQQVYQAQISQVSSTPIQAQYVQQRNDDSQHLPSPVLHQAAQGQHYQTPTGHARYPPVHHQPTQHPHYSEPVPDHLFNQGEYMPAGSNEQGYPRKPLPELQLHHTDLPGTDSSKENFYPMTPTGVPHHANFPNRPPYMNPMSGAGQYWSTPPHGAPICSSKPYGPPRHYRPAPYSFSACHCNSSASLPPCQGYHMGHGHMPSGPRHPRSFNSSYTEYGCHGEPKVRSRRTSSCCNLNHSDFSSDCSMHQEEQRTPGMTPALRAQNPQTHSKQMGDFSQEGARFHSQMMRHRSWNNCSPGSSSDSDSMLKTSCAQPGLGSKPQSNPPSPKPAAPNSLSDPNNPVLANLPPPGLARTKYLVSTYIDYLVEENERVTDMSKAFTPPTYLYLEEEEYILQAHKEDSPFPSNHFSKFIKQYFPQVEAISVPEGQSKDSSTTNINQLKLSEKSFNEFAHTVFFGCQDLQEKKKSVPVFSPQPATFAAPVTAPIAAAVGGD